MIQAPGSVNVQPDKLLAGHTTLLCNDVESFQAYVASMEGHATRHVTEDCPIHFEIRHAQLVRVEVGVCYNSVSMTVEQLRQLSSDYLIQFPLTSSCELALDGHELSVAPASAVVISPGQRVRRSTRAGWTMVFCVPGDQLRSRLEARLGHALDGPLVFRPLVTTAASELLNYGLLVVDAIDRGIAPPQGPVAAVLEDGFLNLLLDLQPHSHDKTLVRSEAETRSDRLRLVTEYLADHFAEPFTVETLAEIAGCSVRSLQAAFAELSGMSPMEYVRRYRLSRARAWLESGQRQVTVSEIAGRSGFTHLARFAASYKARYGEAPSETLRRCRKRYARGA